MKFEVLNPKDFGGKKVGDPTITVSVSGVFMINKYAGEVLGLPDEKTSIGLFKGEDSCYYICNSPGENLPSWSARNKTVNGKRYDAWVFNATALVTQIAADYDLALSKEKKKSIRLDLAKEPVMWGEMKLYEILNPSEQNNIGISKLKVPYKLSK